MENKREKGGMKERGARESDWSIMMKTIKKKSEFGRKK